MLRRGEGKSGARVRVWRWWYADNGARRSQEKVEENGRRGHVCVCMCVSVKKWICVCVCVCVKNGGFVSKAQRGCVCNKRETREGRRRGNKKEAKATRVCL